MDEGKQSGTRKQILPWAGFRLADAYACLNLIRLNHFMLQDSVPAVTNESWQLAMRQSEQTISDNRTIRPQVFVVHAVCLGANSYGLANAGHRFQAGDIQDIPGRAAWEIPKRDTGPAAQKTSTGH